MCVAPDSDALWTLSPPAATAFNASVNDAATLQLQVRPGRHSGRHGRGDGEGGTVAYTVSKALLTRARSAGHLRAFIVLRGKRPCLNPHLNPHLYPHPAAAVDVDAHAPRGQRRGGGCR